VPEDRDDQNVILGSVIGAPIKTLADDKNAAYMAAERAGGKLPARAMPATVNWFS
jgi:hypothetical protein